jgi:hypothetical protein
MIVKSSKSMPTPSSTAVAHNAHRVDLTVETLARDATTINTKG